MPNLYTALEINAPRHKVWRVLYRKERWLYWNTFLYDCDPKQNFVEGKQVLLAMRRVPGDEVIDFEPHITLVHPNTCLQWISTIPGLICEHSFELQDVGENRTQYIHYERFSGKLTRLFLPFIRQDEQKGIHRMAQELKNYAEIK